MDLYRVKLRRLRLLVGLAVGSILLISVSGCGETSRTATQVPSRARVTGSTGSQTVEVDDDVPPPSIPIKGTAIEVPAPPNGFSVKPMDLSGALVGGVDAHGVRFSKPGPLSGTAIGSLTVNVRQDSSLVEAIRHEDTRSLAQSIGASDQPMQIERSPKFGQLVVWPTYMKIPGVSDKYPTRSVSIIEFAVDDATVIQVIADGIEPNELRSYIEGIKVDA